MRNSRLVELYTLKKEVSELEPTPETADLIEKFNNLYKGFIELEDECETLEEERDDFESERDELDEKVDDLEKEIIFLESGGKHNIQTLYVHEKMDDLLYKIGPYKLLEELENIERYRLWK